MLFWVLDAQDGRVVVIQGIRLIANSDKPAVDIWFLFRPGFSVCFSHGVSVKGYVVASLLVVASDN